MGTTANYTSAQGHRVVCYAWRSRRYHGCIDSRCSNPFTADQPGNIAYLVHMLDVAFEFIEVRTGQNELNPIYWTGKTPKGTLEAFGQELNEVLDNLTSEVGLRKRVNAKKRQKILAGAWAPDGPTHTSFDALLQRFSL